MKRITPFLWFDKEALEAAELYVSVFPNSKITAKTPGPDGKMMTVSFTLDGQDFVALNGGPSRKFTEATSFVITCTEQKEIDHYWSKLIEGGGEESMCGWLKDRYGLSWQVVPEGLGSLLQSPGAAGALMKMRKLDIAKLKAAA